MRGIVCPGLRRKIDGKLHMLDVLFDENKNEGTIKGIWPFDFGSRVYGRYMEIEKVKSSTLRFIMYLRTVPLPTPEGPLRMMSKPFFIIIVYYFKEYPTIKQCFKKNDFVTVFFCYD